MKIVRPIRRIFCFPNAVWASASGGFCFVSDTLVLITFCRTETETVSRTEKAGPFDYCCSRQSVASLVLLVRAHSGHFEHIFGVFIVQCVKCVKLMLRIFKFGLLLFDCFVYCQNVTCLKRFTNQAWALGLPGYRNLRRQDGRHNHKQNRRCLFSRYTNKKSK